MCYLFVYELIRVRRGLWRSGKVPRHAWSFLELFYIELLMNVCKKTLNNIVFGHKTCLNATFGGFDRWNRICMITYIQIQRPERPDPLKALFQDMFQMFLIFRCFMFFPRTWVRDSNCVLSACVQGLWWGSDFMVSAGGWFQCYA